MDFLICHDQQLNYPSTILRRQLHLYQSCYNFRLSLSDRPSIFPIFIFCENTVTFSIRILKVQQFFVSFLTSHDCSLPRFRGRPTPQNFDPHGMHYLREKVMLLLALVCWFVC